MTEHETPDRTPESGLWDGEIHLGTLLKLGFGLLALVLVSAALMYFLFGGFLAWEKSREPAPPVLQEARAPVQVPGARLLPTRDATGRPGVTPEQNLENYEKATRERLTTYGWVDESQQVAHIPIERAIEMVANRGLEIAAPPVSAPPVATDVAAASPDAGSPGDGDGE